MSLAYIRSMYRVPAKLGGRVAWRGKPGTILACLPSSGHYVRVRLDERPHGACVLLHPTDDDLVYLDSTSDGRQP